MSLVEYICPLFNPGDEGDHRSHDTPEDAARCLLDHGRSIDLTNLRFDFQYYERGMEGPINLDAEDLGIVRATLLEHARAHGYARLTIEGSFYSPAEPERGRSMSDRLVPRGRGWRLTGGMGNAAIDLRDPDGQLPEGHDPDRAEWPRAGGDPTQGVYVLWERHGRRLVDLVLEPGQHLTLTYDEGPAAGHELIAGRLPDGSRIEVG